MHYLSGIIGIFFAILAAFSWQTPWIGAFCLVCAALAFLAIRPWKMKGWLYANCIASACATAYLLYQFFALVRIESDSTGLSSFDYRFLVMFAGGFAMMYIVSEYCCWLKGREDLVRIKIEFRQWRKNLRITEIS